MDINIGIAGQPSRELSMSSDRSKEELLAEVKTALTAEQPASPLVLTDKKGQTYIIPVANVAYVQIGTESGRTVGFA